MASLLETTNLHLVLCILELKNYTRTVQRAALGRVPRSDSKTVDGGINRSLVLRRVQAGLLPQKDEEMMSKVRFWERVRYEKNGLSVSTDGLRSRGQAELVVPVTSENLLPEAESFLRYVVKYLDDTKARITSGQTFGYGYWVIKFQPINEACLEAWEYDPSGTDLRRGGSLALSYWRDQHAICEKYGASFDPPIVDRLTAISAGVMEPGRPVQAVRYHWGEQMSGWLVVTDLYDGKIESLTNHHTYHLSAARPELAKYLALPYSVRFDLAGGERVWYNPEVANEPYV